METWYADANIFVVVWRGIELALSSQVTRQKTGDNQLPENRRVQALVAYSF